MAVRTPTTPGGMGGLGGISGGFGGEGSGGGLAITVEDVSATSAASYDDADVLRYNLCLNPSFETSVTGWEIVGGIVSISRTNAQAYSGTWSGGVVVGASMVIGDAWIQTSATTTPSVTAGKTYTFSAYLRGSTINGSGRVQIMWLNASGTSAGLSPGVVTGSTSTVSTSWVRVSVTGTAPTGAKTAMLMIVLANSGAEQTMYVDAILFEQAASADTYFDGNSTSAFWLGTTNASASQYQTGDTAYDTVDISYNGATFPVVVLPLEIVVNLYTADGAVDIAGYVTAINIQRGRSRQLDTFQAGTASITVRNESREFDPLNTTSTLREAIEPTRPIAVLVNGIVMFFGFIDTADVTYEIGGTSVAQIACVDATATLATQELATGIDRPEEQSGSRISAILADSQVDLIVTGTDINAGDEPVADDLASGNALEYLRKIERTERGSLFIDRLGRLLYRERSYNSANPGEVTFTDRGTDIPYMDVRVRSGLDLFYNKITFDGPYVDQVTKEDTVSQSTYRLREYSEDDLLYTNDTNAGNGAQAALNLYGTIRPSVSEVQVALDMFSATDRERVSTLDIADAVRVEFTPPGTGSPTTVAQVLTIDGISHEWQVGEIWRTRFALANYGKSPVVILDDTVYGVLDAGYVLA